MRESNLKDEMSPRRPSPGSGDRFGQIWCEAAIQEVSVHVIDARAVTLGPVRELAAATQRSGVGAVFGITERAADGYYITQLCTYGGRLLGSYRKRQRARTRPGTVPGERDEVFLRGMD